MLYTLTAGEVPTQEQYSHAWDTLKLEGELDDDFAFRNDKRIGNVTLSKWELWKEINKANKELEVALQADNGSNESDILFSWISDVLYCLHIEWV